MADKAEPAEPTTLQLDHMTYAETSRMLAGALGEISAIVRSLPGGDERGVDAALSGAVDLYSKLIH